MNTKTKRRSLVLTDEGASHPFLASLPPHVRAGVRSERPRSLWYVSRDDMRGFVTAYAACLAAAIVFIF